MKYSKAGANAPPLFMLPKFPRNWVCRNAALLSYHNGTTTPCLSLSVLVPLVVLNSNKSAVLSPRVPPCRPLSLSGSDYESEGRRFEYCRAHQRKPCKSRGFATVYRVNSYEHR